MPYRRGLNKFRLIVVKYVYSALKSNIAMTNEGSLTRRDTSESLIILLKDAKQRNFKSTLNLSNLCFQGTILYMRLTKILFAS